MAIISITTVGLYDVCVNGTCSTYRQLLEFLGTWYGPERSLPKIEVYYYYYYRYWICT